MALTFSCSPGGGGGGNDGGNNPQTATYTGTAGGITYTLRITEDAYELTAGSKKSTGTVNNVSGGVLTLKPSNTAATFTATVSGSSLTALNGTITWTDNTTASAPGTFTTGSNPGTGSGGLTITDIPAKYNGKYAVFNGSTLGISLVGLQSINTTAYRNSTYSRISNGRVSIPAWVRNADDTIVRYLGNDTISVLFIICEVDTIEEHSKDPSNLLASGNFSPVKFSNGSATVSRNDATNWFEVK